QVALLQGDAEVFELRRHRRIHRLVAAFDGVSEVARERGDAAHEGAGDAKDVEFHSVPALVDMRNLSTYPARETASPPEPGTPCRGPASDLPPATSDPPCGIGPRPGIRRPTARHPRPA